MGPLFIVGIVAAVYILASLRILNEWERGVSFRLGRFAGVKGPGSSSCRSS